MTSAPGNPFTIDKWHDDVVRVVVCDDHALVRRRLIVTLEADPDIDVLAESADGEHGIAVCRDVVPDVVVVGARVEHIGGPRTAAGIREVNPAARVVMLVTHEDEAESVRAIKAGATGFINRESLSHAPTVVKAVSAGVAALPPLVARRVLDDDEAQRRRAPAAGPGQLARQDLTDRERTVLEFLASSKTYGAAAEELGVLEFTAKNLAANAVEKLYRHARTEAVLYAVGERLFAKR